MSAGIAFLVLLAWAAYRFLESDVGLLSDTYCLKMISDDVLGNPHYTPACSRSSYLDHVETLGNKDMATFKFYPSMGMERECPPITVTVDRRNAEAFVSLAMTQR